MSGEMDKRFYMTDKGLFIPYPERIETLIQLEFSCKSVSAPCRQPESAWENPVAEKGEPQAATVEPGGFFWLELQGLCKVLLNQGQLMAQFRLVISKEYKIIHITQVFLFPQLLFNPVIKDAEIIIGKMLGDEVTNGYSLAGSGMVAVQQ